MPKPAGQFRIVCLGGSTTYTSDVKDYRDSYPYLLEKYLKAQGYNDVTVVNAGAGSWSSWESLINFQFRVLDLDPDLIIVYHGINDILRPIAVTTPAPARPIKQAYLCRVFLSTAPCCELR